MAPVIGEPAPDFSLKDQFGTTVSLSQFRSENNVIVVFYPFAFTGICTGELCTMRDRYDDLKAQSAQVLAISCDSVPSLQVFGTQEHLEYPLLSDFWPHGEVSREYGVFLEDKGFPNRGTFVIDREGVLRWSVITSPEEARNIEDYTSALAALI